MISVLAVAGIFGVSSAIINSNTNPFKEAKAWASISSGKRVFLNVNSNSGHPGEASASFKVKYGTSNADSESISPKNTTRIGTSDWYYFDLEYAASYFCILRYDPGGNIYWNGKTNGNIGWNTEYNRPVIQWNNYGSSDSDWYTGALPTNVKWEKGYSGQSGWTTPTNMTWNTTLNCWEEYIDLAANQSLVLKMSEKGSSSNVPIPRDSATSASTTKKGDEIVFSNAGKYRVTVGPNCWSYGSSGYIWGGADGSDIKNAYTVTVRPNTAGYGTVSTTTIYAPSGETYSTSSKTLTVGGTIGSTTTSTATASAATAQYTYTFDSWSRSSGTITSNITITANFIREENDVTLSFKYVVDGVLQDKKIVQAGGSSTWQSLSDGSVTGSYSTPIGNLTEPTYPGCSFDGWYSDATCKTGISSSSIGSKSGNTIYAKFSSLNTSKNLYIGIDGSVDSNKYIVTNWGSDSCGYIVSFNSSDGIISVVKVREMKTISFGGWKYYSFFAPKEATKIVVSYGEWGGRRQTIDLGVGSGTDYIDPNNNTNTIKYANGKNLFVVGGSTENADNNTKRTGHWANIVYYLDVSTSSTFASLVSQTVMSAPANASTHNAAEIFNVSIPASAGTHYYTRAHYVADGNEGFVTAVGGEDGVEKSKVVTRYSIDGDQSVEFAQNLTLNFYVNDSQQIWLVNCSGIDAAGYIYISTDYTPGELKIDCSSSAGTAFSHAKLSSVSDLTGLTTVIFNGKTGMIKVPIFNLRNGTNPSSGVTYSLTLTDSNNSNNYTAITGVSVVTSSPVYHITFTDTIMSSTHTVAVSTTNGQAAKTAYDIATAIQNAKNKSVCEISQDTAIDLCKAYDANSGNALLTGSKIKTWASEIDDSGADINMRSIRYQLGKKAGGNYVIALLGNFSLNTLFGEEDSLSTVIIIVASSVALLSITALSSSLFFLHSFFFSIILSCNFCLLLSSCFLNFSI